MTLLLQNPSPPFALSQDQGILTTRVSVTTETNSGALLMWKSECRGSGRVEPAIRQILPPCQIRCPINEDIQRTNVLLSLLPRDLESALPGIVQIGDTLYEKNPLFTICGYVCGLCELGCNYSSKGGAIRRRLLKRFIADHYRPYLEQKKPFSIQPERGQIAVIGGGPAGLMAAFDLSRRGYRVTLFEAEERLGGALWLIPAYRLPDEILAAAIDSLIRIARIEVRYHSRIGCGELTLESLKTCGFEALFIAKGSPSPRVLSFAGEKLEGQNLCGVMFGHDFLYEVSHGNIGGNYFKGQRVIVIGGGNVAFDVARSARRLGGDTSLVCLECEDKKRRDGIPADDDEIKGAWEEGVHLLYSRGVRKIFGKEGIFGGIETVPCRQVYDDTGFNPSFDLDSPLWIQGEVLIIAVGQGPDRDLLCQEGLLDAAGHLAIDPLTLQSLNLPSVFVGGDMRHIGFMVEAMQDGLVAAESIDRFLRNADLHEGRLREYQPQEIPLRRHYLHEPEICWVPPEKRLHFELFEEGFDIGEAIDEARRCLACGPCVSCKACISVGMLESLPTVEVDAQRCCGCGICVTACTYGSAQLRVSGEKILSTTDPFSCKACGQCVIACPSSARRMVGDPTASRVQRVLTALAEKKGQP